MRYLAYFGVVSSAFVLVACGGGGGGGSSSAATPQTEPVTLSTSNYTTVADESTSASIDVGGLSSFGSVVTGAEVQAQQRWASWGLNRFLAARAAPQPAAVVVGVTQPVEDRCLGGGVVRTTYNDVGEAGASNGDTIALVFNQCVDNGDTISGTLTVTINGTFTYASSSSYSVNLTMAFANLTLLSGGVQTGANGTLRLASQRTALNVGSDDVVASGLVSSATVGATTRQRTVIGFNSHAVYDANGVAMTFAGTVASSVLNGRSVEVSTPTPFRSAYTDVYPVSGQLKAVGANGASVTLTVVNDTTVSLAVDTNGDGTAEQSSQVPWSSIL